jgi:hypothetical protein
MWQRCIHVEPRDRPSTALLDHLDLELLQYVVACCSPTSMRIRSAPLKAAYWIPACAGTTRRRANERDVQPASALPLGESARAERAVRGKPRERRRQNESPPHPSRHARALRSRRKALSRKGRGEKGPCGRGKKESMDGCNERQEQQHGARGGRLARARRSPRHLAAVQQCALPARAGLPRAGASLGQGQFRRPPRRRARFLPVIPGGETCRPLLRGVPRGDGGAGGDRGLVRLARRGTRLAATIGPSRLRRQRALNSHA